MPLLSHNRIREMVRVGVEAGFDRRRDEMLAGLAPAYVAGLIEDKRPASQLMLDLATMNNDKVIADGVVPLLNGC
jgi:hypothetical protein